MEEERMTKYAVCKRRNVAAAYERFLGPSAGALPEPWHVRTFAGLLQALGLQRPLRRERVPQAGERAD